MDPSTRSTDPRATGPEELWDRHGPALFALARALLADESAALTAVSLGLVDVYARPHPDTTLRSVARCIYRRCERPVPVDVAASAPESRLISGLGEVAWLQRSALVLCMFGGHTYREVATELDIPADAVAWLLLSGLRELSGLGSSLRSV